MFTIRPSRAPACAAHRLGAVEGACQVDVEVALPELGRLVVELRGVVERAGVVDEDVDRAELLDRACDRRVHLLAVGHVALDRSGAAAELLDLARGRLGVDDPLRFRDLGERPPLCDVGVVGLDLDVRDHDVGPRAPASARLRARAHASRP